MMKVKQAGLRQKTGMGWPGGGQVRQTGWGGGHPAGWDHYPHAGFPITEGSLNKAKTNFLFQKHISIYLLP